MHAVRRFAPVAVAVAIVLSLAGYSRIEAAALAAGDSLCVGTSTLIEDEVTVTGVTREHIVVESFTAAEDTLGNRTPDVRTVVSVLCIDAPGGLQPPDSTGTPTSEIGQLGDTWITVLEGTLEVKLVRSCVDTVNGVPCSSTGGRAAAASAGASSSTPLAEGVWTPVSAGGNLFLSNVTIEVRTLAGSNARVVTYGVHPAPFSGGGCPAACWQFP